MILGSFEMIKKISYEGIVSLHYPNLSVVVSERANGQSPSAAE